MADDSAEDASLPGVDPGFFAPDHAEGTYLAFGGRVTVPRLLLRALVCLVALVLLDRLIAPTLAPPSAFLDSYRLPRTAPTAALASYADAIDRTASASDRPPVAIFLGASPTWGHRIRDRRATYPYAYASAAASAGVAVRPFNLASNGQFVGDYYLIAKRLAPDADIVFVQLTYHTFSPTAREGRHVRYPELPQVLGIGLSADEARMLALTAGATAPGAGPAPAPPSRLAFVDGALSRYWLLWRERDTIDTRLFGGHPQRAVADAVDRLRGAGAPSTPVSTTVLPDDAADEAFASFETLDPARQMVAIAQYAEDSAFTIDAKEGEVVVLDRLAALLAADGVKAVFYIAPLNRSIVDEYGLIDPKQYAANTAVLRGVVEARGATFIDYNSGPVAVPGTEFADISHTTDAGGRIVGALLYRDTASLLAGVTP
ncbi:MAG: hypothetical protein Q7W30_02625 [Coriobacteriia bacterium]|nr:hypothetical protein [Coriobacteriia bacterium]